METKIIKKNKRYKRITDFCTEEGLSYATVDYLCKSGQLKVLMSEKGTRWIDTEDGSFNPLLAQRLEKIEKIVTDIGKIFNLKP